MNSGLGPAGGRKLTDFSEVQGSVSFLQRKCLYQVRHEKGLDRAAENGRKPFPDLAGDETARLAMVKICRRIEESPSGFLTT
jgi:hypothetical protein